MQLKRWFFGAGAALGAVAVYQIVTQRKSQVVQAPSTPTTPRAPLAPPTPFVSRAQSVAPKPAAAPAAPTLTAATEPVATKEDLRKVVTAAAGPEEEATTPIAAAMATAVAELAQEENTAGAEQSKATRVIGNTHKMVYHMESDAHLPIEDNRAYFATEQDAIDAGYRKAEPLA